MLDIPCALRDEQFLRYPIGLKEKQFKELRQKFDVELRSCKLIAKPARKQAMSGDRKHTLEGSAGMLFFILLYLLIYPTMAVACFLFGVGLTNYYQRTSKRA